MFSSEWTSNSTHHWHACTDPNCTLVSGKAEHTFGEFTVTKEPTSDEAGEKNAKCTVCDKLHTEIIEKLPAKMSIEEWYASFTLENFKMTVTVDMDTLGSSTMITLVDGETVLGVTSYTAKAAVKVELKATVQ